MTDEQFVEREAEGKGRLMPQPVRLRLSRAKGFDLQAVSKATNGLEAVNVARPGKWGNPFVIGLTRCTGTGFDYREEKITDAATAVRFFCEMLPFADRGYPSTDEIKRELRGKNLACWCHASPCHADVLLEIANA